VKKFIQFWTTLAALVLFSSPLYAQDALPKATQDRIAAYIHVAVAWFANEHCKFLSSDERTAFQSDVAKNTVGIGAEIDLKTHDRRKSNALLFDLQGEAKKYSAANYQDCPAEAEKVVRDAVLEAAAINDSIAKRGPYVDPRRK
jgi:hypothetical protein